MKSVKLSEFSKMDIWHNGLYVSILAHLVYGLQNAGHYCVSDSQSPDLLHIDFVMDTGGDAITYVYGYRSSDQTLLPDCHSQYDSVNKVHRLRITMNTTSQEQVNPQSSCGGSHSAGIYKVVLKSFVGEEFISKVDRLYTLQCESSSETLTKSNVTVENMDHMILTGSSSIKMYLVSPTDLQPKSVLQIGEKVKVMFTLTFTNSRENLDIVGARLKNLIVSPKDNFMPIKRTIIDENGCPVNHSENVLKVSGPFETVSNGSSPFIAYSPELEIAKFSGSTGFLYFRLNIEYCYSVQCFQSMCEERQKRETGNQYSAVTQVFVEVNDPLTKRSPVSQATCYSKATFTAIMSVIASIIVIEIAIVLVGMKKLADLKSMVTPSPDVSFDKIPISNTYYRNPVNGYHPTTLKKNIGSVVL